MNDKTFFLLEADILQAVLKKNLQKLLKNILQSTALQSLLSDTMDHLTVWL